MTHIIDLNFLKNADSIAAFLLPTTDGLVLVETGPYSTFPSLKAGIEQLGFQVSDVRHVFLSHIHLDHAGAAWAFAERGATIYVHPAGYPHLLDPSRLMNSARRIYQDQMDVLWGDMKAIPADRLRAVNNEEQIEVGDLTFQAWHTPGHAVHHIAWQCGEELFAGDVAGVSIQKGLVVPPCPPPDINIEDWKASINLLREMGDIKIYLTHFGLVDNNAQHLSDLEWQLDNWAQWMKPHWEAGEAAETVIPKFQAYVAGQLSATGIDEEGIKKYEAANPSWMSVAGLMRYWRKKEG
ncbi:MAG: MBL fold metallo-hydrolase [Bacteroidota bacterium]